MNAGLYDDWDDQVMYVDPMERDAVVEGSDYGSGMPGLPEKWTYGNSLSFLLLCCALKDPPAPVQKNEAQPDYKAAAMAFSFYDIDLASRHLEELLRGDEPGRSIGRAAAKHAMHVAQLGREASLVGSLPTLKRLAKKVGTADPINSAVVGICNDHWKSADEAVAYAERYEPIPREKVEEDAGRLLQWQVSCWEWKPSTKISWKQTRGLYKETVWDRISYFFRRMFRKNS